MVTASPGAIAFAVPRRKKPEKWGRQRVVAPILLDWSGADPDSRGNGMTRLPWVMLRLIRQTPKDPALMFRLLRDAAKAPHPATSSRLRPLRDSRHVRKSC
ncbi:hypothetical protein [Polyangium spumosum]|uniref:Uncharacterized protein n=1 Tax=Polyangium spumosum TaxID=889282 RepID=A0A6N7Q759_9BACT|nr:hypothetical protein [Polyangium spumosum]MRG96721.1 hypothetical protein [Polyangium spumosum]